MVVEYTEPFSTAQIFTLAAVVITSSLLSLFGASSVLLVTWRGSRQILKTAPMLIGLSHLSAADLLAATLLLMTAITSMFDSSSEGKYSNLCVYGFGVPLNISYRCTFLLTFSFAMQMFYAVRGQHNTKVMFVLRLLSWTMPLVVTPFLFISEGSGLIKNSSPLSWCSEVLYLSSVLYVRAVTASLYVPLCCVMIVNPIVYYYVYRDYNRLIYSSGSMTERERAERRRVLMVLMAYLGVFYLCWSPNLVEIIAFYSKTLTHEQLFPVYILQCLLNPLQGFLNAMVMGWSNRTFVQLARSP